MGDYIERQMAIDAIGKAMPEPSTPDFKGVRDYEVHIACEAFTDATMIIKNISSAKVRPVVHGKWEHDHTDMVGGNFAVVRCSVCGYKAYAIADHIRNGNFCPNCGAQMDGGGNL